MSEKHVRRSWSMGIGIAVSIVAIVAALLLTIIGVARSILQRGERALDLANELVATTRPIWNIDQTNEAANRLLETAQSLERNATEVADTLERPRSPGVGS